MAKLEETKKEQPELTQQQKIVQRVFSQPKTVLTLSLSLTDGLIVGIDGISQDEAKALIAEAVKVLNKDDTTTE